jgi:raffinose/stachyose/melibiose transport system permease protein
VQSRSKSRLYFLAFVLPALALYSLFFLYPFGRGLAISFTNWDGLTPTTPISMPRTEFESLILSKVGSETDRSFILSIYSLDATEGLYRRLAVRGADRSRLERLLRSVGYEPTSYRSVGFGNYASIFRGEVDARFYPRRYVKTNYNEDASLPAQIDKDEFERVFLANADVAERKLALRHYRLDGETYRLDPAKDEFAMEDLVWLLPEVELEGKVEGTAVEAFIAVIKRSGLEDDRAAADSAVASFVADLSQASAELTKRAANDIFDLGAMKRSLATRWVESKLDLGVVGFTAFFAVVTVVSANLLAFFVALALDTKIKSRNVLRSVFFLPNVLSMIVVALIWSIVFARLLPRVTGIEVWMGDPDKAPWLVAFVAVWQMAGYYMVIYLAGLQGIPTEVLEAATIDGARGWLRLRRVILPLLVPAITVCLFLSTANALKCFDLVYALSGPSGYALGTVPFVMDIFFDAFAKKLAGLATAKATLLFLVILAVTGVQLLVMKRKEVQA